MADNKTLQEQEKENNQKYQDKWNESSNVSKALKIFDVMDNIENIKEITNYETKPNSLDDKMLSKMNKYLQNNNIDLSEEGRNNARLDNVIEGTPISGPQKVKETVAWLGANPVVDNITDGVFTATGWINDWLKNKQVKDNVVKMFAPIIGKNNSKAAKEIADTAKDELKTATKSKLIDTNNTAKALGDFEKGYKSGKFVDKSNIALRREKDQIFKDAISQKNMIDYVDNIYRYDTSNSVANRVKKVTEDFTEKYARTNSGRKRSAAAIQKLLDKDEEYKEALRLIADADYYARFAKQLSGGALRDTAVMHTLSHVPNMVRAADRGQDNKSKADLPLPKPYKKEMEMDFWDSLSEAALNLFDFAKYDPEKYPIETIDNVISKINDSEDGLGKYFNPRQIAQLSGPEKVRLVKDIMAGKYNDENNNLTYELLKAYRNIANNTDKETE